MEWTAVVVPLMPASYGWPRLSRFLLVLDSGPSPSVLEDGLGVHCRCLLSRLVVEAISGFALSVVQPRFVAILLALAAGGWPTGCLLADLSTLVGSSARCPLPLFFVGLPVLVGVLQCSAKAAMHLLLDVCLGGSVDILPICVMLPVELRSAGSSSDDSRYSSRI